MIEYYKIRSWVNVKALNMELLSMNVNALDFFEKNPEWIHKNLSKNPSPKMIYWLENNFHLFSKEMISILSLNKSQRVIDFLIKNPHLIDWELICINSNHKVIELLELEENFHFINFTNLSLNTGAISLLEKHPHLMNGNNVSSNTGAISLLEKYPHLINGNILSRNPNAIPFLEKNPHFINGDILERNPNPNAQILLEKNTNQCYRALSLESFGSSSKSKNEDKPIINEMNEYLYWKKLSKSSDPKDIKLLEKNIDKINIPILCENTHSDAIQLLKKIIHEGRYENLLINNRNINWDRLCSNTNPNVIDILKEHPTKINKYNLSKNPSDNAIDYLMENIHMVDWKGVSRNSNPRIIQLIEDNLDNVNWNDVDWNYLSIKPSIFEYDYQRMAVDRTHIIVEELMQKVWKPTMIKNLLDNNIEVDEFI